MMSTIRGLGDRAIPRLNWPGGRSLPSAIPEEWPVACGVALAALAGYLVGGGHWELAVVAIVTPAFMITAAAAPERTALGLIVVLPFLFYPAGVGRFSLFLAVPLFGFTGLMLMTRQRASLHGLRRWLPVPAFAVLVAIAVATAAASTDHATAFSRVLYLVLFGWFAWALATALMAGRLSRESVAKAIVYSGALAALAVLIQFGFQFAGGKQSVIDWLLNVQAMFAGQKAANISTINWVIDDFDLLRGIFPFMSPPSAGQYLMLTLIAGVWLRRERKASTGVGSTAEILLLALIAAALLVTFSRQAWLGAVVGVIALGVRRRPVWMLAIVAQCFLVLSVVPIPGGNGSFGEYLLDASNTSSTSSATRLGLWDQAIDLVPQHAVLGVGPGLYGTLNPDPSHPIYYAHNVFLDNAVELGILGALAFLALFLLALRSALRRAATLAFAMLTAYVVANLFDDVLYTPRNGLLLAVAFALIAGRDRTGGRDQPPEERSARRAPLPTNSPPPVETHASPVRV